jgi:hypothetical protein
MDHSVSPGKGRLQGGLGSGGPEINRMPLHIAVRGRVLLGFTAGNTNQLETGGLRGAGFLEALQECCTDVSGGSGYDDAHWFSSA